MGEFAALLTFIGFVIACWFIWLVVSTSWPVCGWFALALATFLICKQYDNPWARAAKSVASSSAFGLGIVTAGLMIFNLFPSDLNVATVISSTELFLLRLSHGLPAWAKPAFWQLALVLLALVSLNRFAPSMALVARFVRMKKILGRTTAAVAAATSFSYFTSDDVLGKMVVGPRDRLTARYVSSQERERDHLERYLLLRTKAEILGTLSSDDQRLLSGIHRNLVAVERRSPTAADEIARTISVRHLRRAGDVAANAGVGPNWSLGADAHATERVLQLPPPPENLIVAPSAVLQAQDAKEAKAKTLAREAEQAMEEAFNAAVGAGTKKSQKLAHALLDPIFESFSLPVTPELTSFLDKVSDEYVKTVVDPVVKKWANKLARDLLNDRPPGSITDRIGATLVRGIVRQQLELARTLANKGVAALPRVALFSPEAPVTLTDTRIPPVSPKAAEWFRELLEPPSKDSAADAFGGTRPETGVALPSLFTGGTTPEPSDGSASTAARVPGVQRKPPSSYPDSADQSANRVATASRTTESDPVLPRSIPDRQVPPGVTEEMYDDARSQVAEAEHLLSTYGAVAADMGICGNTCQRIEETLVANREVLALYEPTFTAIAEKRREQRRRELEERREMQRRAEELRTREREVIARRAKVRAVR